MNGRFAATVLRRSYRLSHFLRCVVLAWMIFGFAWILASARPERATTVWLPSLWALASVAFLARLAEARRGRPVTCPVDASPEGVSIEGACVLRRESIHHAIMKMRGGGSQVCFRDHLGSLELGFPSAPSAAAEIIRSLELGASEAIARYTFWRGTSRSQKIRRWSVAAVLVAGTAAAFLFGVVLWTKFSVLMVGALAVLGSIPFVQVSVYAGADGIRWRPLFGRERFLPYAHVASASIQGNDILVTSNRGVELAMHWRDEDAFAFGGALMKDQAAELASRLQAHLGRDEAAEGSSLIPGRATSRLYREPAIDTDTLWRIVESGVGPAVDRRQAARVLSADVGNRARLLRVGGASAAPAFRQALEEIASGPEETADRPCKRRRLL